MPALLALFGPKQGLRIPLAGRLLLGRGPSADLQLVDGKVSREHCRFDATGARPMLEDLGSQNGTYVNGERIDRPTPLAEGDEIALGDTLLLVSDDQVEVANARYGAGTFLVSAQGRASTAANPGPPIVAQPGKDGLHGVGALAARLASAHSEEDAATAILDVVEAELSPKRATLLLRLWQNDGASKERVVALATRGKEAVVSISRTLLERAAIARRGVLVEDALGSRELRGVRSVVLHSLRSVMVVPWGQGDDSPRGFLQVDREPERPFTLPDLAWLETVGHLTTLRLGERPQPVATDALEGPVGASPAFVSALTLATAAARVGSTVLLLGETGTGKEEVAHLIHNRSRQSRGPFVAVSCGAIAEKLAESELFGHEKGVFNGATCTRLGAFEAADGGTLFLDDVGDLTAALQVKLLRVLQERAVVRVGAQVARQVDVHIIAATHRDLAADVKARLFREDLYSRLNGVSLVLPSLRERRDDIPLLARVLLDRTATRLGLRSPGLTAEAEAALSAWEYPGNVRELANVLERVLVLRDPRDPGSIDRDDVLAALGFALRTPPPVLAGVGEDRLSDAVARAEKQNIEAALRRARGVKSHAARILGISRPTLDKKIADSGDRPLGEGRGAKLKGRDRFRGFGSGRGCGVPWVAPAFFRCSPVEVRQWAVERADDEGSTGDDAKRALEFLPIWSKVVTRRNVAMKIASFSKELLLVAGFATCTWGCGGTTSAPTGTGGSPGTGGSNGTGGAASTGGTVGTGGASASGGTGSGGKSGNGGSTGSGGSTGNGGSTGSGGNPGSGGSTGSGGSSGRGGSTGNGGRTGGGGSTGSGGSTGTGGSTGSGVDGGGSTPAGQSAGCGKTSTITSSQYNNGNPISITVGSQQRRYILSVPTNYVNTTPYKFILGIHALNSNDKSVYSEKYYGLQPLSNNTVIFAAPNGVNGSNPCSGTGVGDSGCGWPSGNMPLIDAVVKQVTDNFCVDTNHIYATGWSYGASMSYEIGCERPLGGPTATANWGVRAVALYAVRQMSGSCKPSIPIGYYLSHGTNDTVLGYDGGVSLTQTYSTANGCTWATPPKASGSHICTNLTGCKTGYPVEFCSFVGGHTAYPDSGSPGNSWGPAEVWKFFSQF